MIHFAHPEAFLLAIPIALWLRRRLWPRTAVGLLRCGLLVAALALLAQPYLASGATGRDLILLLDRSRSAPVETTARLQELAGIVRDNARPGDRIGMVSFGADAAVESPPTEDFRYAPPTGVIDTDATDLANAIDTALALIPEGRHGSIVVVSDGEATGGDADAAARTALRRGIRIDAFAQQRATALDVAIEEVSTPHEAGADEPFAFSAWIRADRPVEVPFRVLRDGLEIASGTRQLQRGLNRIRLRDRLNDPGIHTYDVTIDLPGDRVAENNRARAVTRVVAPFRVLCITPSGRRDRLTDSLRQAGLEIVVSAPETAPVDLDSLDAFRAVILENVAADDLPNGGIESLAQYVRHLGGGLLMTGGGASFGNGGYYRSDIEDVLPVSMEIREEQRKFALAMAIVLDRSGSMAATVGSQTKMDLANLGTVAAIDLLGRADHVAVVAVDSSPHVIIEASPVVDRAAIESRVLAIESSGGGIYTYTALEAAAAELVETPQLHKHIVLFADTADAEEQAGCVDFVRELGTAGVTVSVIGLGSDTDVDVSFLRDVAAAGGGRSFVVGDATELPRVFAQETLQVARSSLIEQPTAIETRAAIIATGQQPSLRFPTIGGYSIGYAKAEAQIGAITLDDQQAPLFSFWQHGLGRTAAFLGEVDGDLSGGLGAWSEYAMFFATAVRWVAGSDAGSSLFATMTRDGHQAVLSVEVEPGTEDLLDTIEPRILAPDGSTVRATFVRVSDQRVEARFPLGGQGVYRGAVKVGDDQFVRVPAVTLPYSAEFERRADPRSGERHLRRIVEIADGRVDPPVDELWAGDRESAGFEPISAWFAWLAVLLLVTEIAVRRLGLVTRSLVEFLPETTGKSLIRRSSGRAPEPAASSLPGKRELEPSNRVSKSPEDSDAVEDLGSVLERARARASRRKS